jgi:pyruvate/2-oxoglutarate/acetoin dehydrogenase E1 component
MRGLKPVVDIQYLDYLIYCLQGMSDDLATVHYRSAGGQKAPVIVRTKGHRLEGIWHTGSPMGMLLGSLRGMHICVPRNCVQAAGFYQTLFAGDHPALVIEVLNSYRVKELCPSNLGFFSLPLGVPEILKVGHDITLVTYGANIRIAEDAIAVLQGMDIDVELIDVQTLLPFDRSALIRQSIEKTHAVLFFDEDVPGGATAYMMQKVLEEQDAYDYLDTKPRTLCAKDHRSAYGSDGDYFCKPHAEDVIQVIYEMMRDRYPVRFPDYL